MRPELVPGSRGIFDVRLDDDLIFSRHASSGRFPVDGEVEAALGERLGHGS